VIRVTIFNGWGGEKFRQLLSCFMCLEPASCGI